MIRKTTSIKINQDIWKKVKKRCIEEDIHISDYLERTLKAELKKK